MNLQTVLPLLLALKGGNGMQKTATQGSFDFSKLPETIKKLQSGDFSALLSDLNLDEKTKTMFRMIASVASTPSDACRGDRQTPSCPSAEEKPKPSAVPNEISHALKMLMEKNS